MKNNILIIIIVALVVGGGGFYAGMRYQASKRPDFSQTGRLGRQGQLGNRTGARQVTGEILSKDDKSFTVKLPDGSSKIVFFSESMTINKLSQATKADLKTGEKVAVFGLENSDGSVTAQSVQLNPITRSMNGGAPRQ